MRTYFGKQTQFAFCGALVSLVFFCSCSHGKPPQANERPKASYGSRTRVSVRDGNEAAVQAKVADLRERINDHPDLLHRDFTPAVNQLIEIGLPSLRYGTLDLLLSDDHDTRMRAWRVVWWIARSEVGFVRGRSSNDPYVEKKWDDLLTSNGTCDEDTPMPQRRISYQKWLQWVQAGQR